MNDYMTHPLLLDIVPAYNETRPEHLPLQEPVERHTSKIKSLPLLFLAGMILPGILGKRNHIMYMLQKVRYINYKIDYLYNN
jgi:hypothetical protein